ncbi:unnamed protein product, partial [Oikopleura dioica]
VEDEKESLRHQKKR